MSWEEFTDRAVQANDKELVGKINIVEKYTCSLPGYIKILEEQAQYSIVDPRCVFVCETIGPARVVSKLNYHSFQF